MRHKQEAAGGARRIAHGSLGRGCITLTGLEVSTLELREMLASALQTFGAHFVN
jgi:hypothetical protein